ncbi:MAG: dienelactone hydrolase family protein [Gammaproteobacteria bacterium]|nr:dienelactone hydrolase family protein [Gammaproteobacteria bacterium]
MCDERTLKDNEAFFKKEGKITRRKFNKYSAGAGLAMMLPPVANAQEVVSENVEVTTPGGIADCFYVHPATGSHAAVLIWPDIFGLRPAFEAMGTMLAQSGYSVLVVNPFYRLQKAPTSEQGADFSDPDTRNMLFSQMGSLTPETQFQDAEAFVTWLDAQDEVDTSRGIGTTGYCMGGSIVMRTAAAMPHRILAGATFHGGNGMASDAEDSAHLLIPQTKAQMLHALAANDDAQAPEVKDVLAQAYQDAGIPAEIEVYNAQHGWCSLDSAVYDDGEAERAHGRLLTLFESALA